MALNSMMCVCGVPVNLYELVDYYKYDFYKVFKYTEDITYGNIINQITQFNILNLSDFTNYYCSNNNIYNNYDHYKLFSQLSLFPISCNQKIDYYYISVEKPRGVIEKIKNVLRDEMKKNNIDEGGAHFILGVEAANEQIATNALSHIHDRSKKYEIYSLLNKMHMITFIPIDSPPISTVF